MRPVSALTFTAVLGAVALLPACNGGGGSPAQSSLVPAAPGSGSAGPRPTHRVTHAVAQPYLYVADEGYSSFNGIIDVLHTGNYDELGWFTAGVAAPLDVFLDKSGNLYVANFYGSNVTEYAPGSWSEPSFTYSSGMEYPRAVAVDVRGNVYEADFSDFINEYYPGRKQPIAHCTTPGGTFGVAVDTAGDVFASVYIRSLYISKIYEYKGGLSACKATVLSLSASTAFGLAVDKNSNLIIANSSDVEIADAPNYNTVNGTIGSGFAEAVTVHLNKANTLAFVTDIFNDTVTVVNYSTGANELVLGGNYGLEYPYAAVEQPNAVY